MAAKRRKKKLGAKRNRRIVDQTALHELELFAENTGELYPMKQAIKANLDRKKKAGKYDKRLAPKAWRHWVDASVKRYEKEFGKGAMRGASGATREDMT